MAVTLTTDDGARFSASLTGRRTFGAAAAAPAAIRGAVLIRVHGVTLWLRRLPCGPDPTTTRRASDDDHLEPLEHPDHRTCRRLARPRPRPDGLRTAVSAAVARRLFLAALGRLPVTVHPRLRRASGSAGR